MRTPGPGSCFSCSQVGALPRLTTLQPVAASLCKPQRHALHAHRDGNVSVSAAAVEAPSASTSGKSEQASKCPFGGGALFTRITDTPAACPFGGVRNFTIKETDYQPWKEPPFDMATGLAPLADRDDLFEIDEYYLEELEERRQLLKQMRTDVFAAFPEAAEASQELLDIVADILPRKYPDRFAREGHYLHNVATGETWDVVNPAQHPLEVASLLVQEDLVLLLPDKQGRPRMVAGAVLFPMRWALLQKMGRPMHLIHAPVPFYQKELKKPVDEFMDELTPEQPFWRANWSVTDVPALFQLLTEKDIVAAKKGTFRAPSEEITVDNAGERLFMRCERQVLCKFPKTGATLFTIRTYVKPMSTYADQPATLQRLRNALPDLPELWLNYKTMNNVKDVTMAYLDRCLAAHN